MGAAAAHERRRHPRSLLQVNVSLSCSGDDEVHTFSVHDISLSGMAIYSPSSRPEVGDKLCLCLSGQEETCSRDHIIEATVVHHREGLVGIRFDSVGVLILKDIQRLLRGVIRF